MEILLEKVELGRSVKTISIGCCAVLSHVGLCNPIDGSLPGSSLPGNSPGKSIEVGCHALFQGICPT